MYFFNIYLIEKVSCEELLRTSNTLKILHTRITFSKHRKVFIDFLKN